MTRWVVMWPCWKRKTAVSSSASPTVAAEEALWNPQPRSFPAPPRPSRRLSGRRFSAGFVLVWKALRATVRAAGWRTCFSRDRSECPWWRVVIIAIADFAEKIVGIVASIIITTVVLIITTTTKVMCLRSATTGTAESAKKSCYFCSPRGWRCTSRPQNYTPRSFQHRPGSARCPSETRFTVVLYRVDCTGIARSMWICGTYPAFFTMYSLCGRPCASSPNETADLRGTCPLISLTVYQCYYCSGRAGAARVCYYCDCVVAVINLVGIFVSAFLLIYWGIMLVFVFTFFFLFF